MPVPNQAPYKPLRARIRGIQRSRPPLTSWRRKCVRPHTPIAPSARLRVALTLLCALLAHCAPPSTRHSRTRTVCHFSHAFLHRLSGIVQSRCVQRRKPCVLSPSPHPPRPTTHILQDSGSTLHSHNAFTALHAFHTLSRFMQRVCKGSQLLKQVYFFSISSAVVSPFAMDSASAVFTPRCWRNFAIWLMVL